MDLPMYKKNESLFSSSNELELKNGAATDPSSCSLEYSSFNNESIFNNMQAADEISVRT